MLLHQPSSADIQAILALYARKLRCASDLSLAQAGEELCASKASASEVECFVRNAFMHAIRERIEQMESTTDNKSGAEGVEHTVQQRHFDLALQDLLGDRSDGAGGSAGGGADSSSGAGDVNDAALAVNTAATDKPSFEWSGGFSFGV